VCHLSWQDCWHDETLGFGSGVQQEELEETLSRDHNQVCSGISAENQKLFQQVVIDAIKARGGAGPEYLEMCDEPCDTISMPTRADEGEDDNNTERHPGPDQVQSHHRDLVVNQNPNHVDQDLDVIESQDSELVEPTNEIGST
jgi:hypothetical protein